MRLYRAAILLGGIGLIAWSATAHHSAGFHSLANLIIAGVVTMAAIGHEEARRDTLASVGLTFAFFIFMGSALYWYSRPVWIAIDVAAILYVAHSLLSPVTATPTKNSGSPERTRPA